MKPFNLERALAGDKVIFADPVLYRTDEILKVYEIPEIKDEVVIVVKNFNCGVVVNQIWTRRELRMAPTKRTVWVIIVKTSRDRMVRPSGLLYDSKEEALRYAASFNCCDKVLGVFPLEIEE